MMNRQPPYLDTRLNHTLNQLYVSSMKACGETIRLEAPDVMSASTDMGNATYALPGLHQFFGIPCPPDVSGHHPSFTLASGTQEAHDSAVRSGKGLALTGWSCIVDYSVMETVTADFEDDKSLRE